MPCQEIIPNCIYCLGLNTCYGCDVGYYLSSNTTCSPLPPCNVGNCDLCDPHNSHVCLNCSIGYTLYTSICSVVACPTGKVYTPDNGCVCPTGSFFNGSDCKDCSDIHCLNCSDSTTCTACTDGYFLDHGNCSACQKSCLVCSSNATCTTCYDGYFVFNSSCV